MAARPGATLPHYAVSEPTQIPHPLAKGHPLVPAVETRCARIVPTQIATFTFSLVRCKECRESALDRLVKRVLVLEQEWAGPDDPKAPHLVAHQHPDTGVLTFHMHGTPDQLEYLIDALRFYEERGPG